MCVLSGDTHTYINTYVPYARIYIVTWVNKSKVQKQQFWLADTLDSYLLSSCLRMAWHNGNSNNDNQHEGPADAPFQPQFDGIFSFLLVAILHTCCLVSELSKEDWIYTEWYHPIWSNHDFFLSFFVLTVHHNHSGHKFTPICMNAMNWRWRTKEGIAIGIFG